MTLLGLPKILLLVNKNCMFGVSSKHAVTVKGTPDVRLGWAKLCFGDNLEHSGGLAQ